MRYKINELFYSLKGEGLYTGVPMTFIRLAGCNLKCEFCDTNHESFTWYTEREILDWVREFPTRRVVITGGEPTIYNLASLTQALVDHDMFIHLETNGMLPLQNHFDWVAVSPKNEVLDRDTVWAAHEVKFLIGQPGWEDLIHDVLRRYPNELINTKLMVMPIAKSWKEGNRTEEDIINENTLEAIEFCKKDPRFRFCIQLHKYLGIK